MHCNLSGWRGLSSVSLSAFQKSSVVTMKSELRTLSTTIPHMNSTKPQSSFTSAGLKRLPVPALSDTMAKYLRSVKPFLSESEFNKTKQVVLEFSSDAGPGPKLQKMLESKAATTDNWLAEWWLNTAYLECRSPVIVYSSPGLVFPLQKISTREDQLSHAAMIIHGALCFKQSIDSGTVAQEYMGSKPLDMSQYYKLFGTTRRPGETKDQLIFSPNSQHIAVIYKNHFYKVDVYQNGKMLSPEDLMRQLISVREQTQGLVGIPVGLLTSEDRTVWAKAYERLQRDPVNREAIDVIEKALFTVSIDRHNRPVSLPKLSEKIPKGTENLEYSERQTAAAKQMIHGGKTNSGNRWFDKTIQFIIGAEGEVGITYEHSAAEGPPIAALMDYVVQYLENNNPASLLSVKPGNIVPPKPIPFNVTHKKITKAIADAKEHLYTLSTDLDMSCFTFKKFGKDFIKSCKLSPDSFIQMAIQAAFYKLHRVPGAHYESASTRLYIDGRTETIRSCSTESIEFAKALIDDSMSPAAKFAALKTAVEGHKKYAQDAIQGYGVDRHLLGLKLLALESGMGIPNFYKDPGFTRSTHFRISTSQVSSPFEAFMAYGPLVQNGYGCCYNPRKHDIVFGISGYNSCTETHSDNFKDALEESLVDMQQVSAQSSVPPAKL